jgi:hypothetical protein
VPRRSSGCDRYKAAIIIESLTTPQRRAAALGIAYLTPMEFKQQH